MGHCRCLRPASWVNFSGSELNNLRLIEKISWELGRFNLSPDRLAVEVLESVISGAADDQITLNINSLVALGCHFDLDGFGTGHASISSIRRFKIDRLKIDRSFVMKADRDPEQQRLISAVLTTAERLNLVTLAEGVETVGDRRTIGPAGLQPRTRVWDWETDAIQRNFGLDAGARGQTSGSPQIGGRQAG